jgi:hypothetical protein
MKEVSSSEKTKIFFISVISYNTFTHPLPDTNKKYAIKKQP